MASLATPQVLERLGADVVTLNASVDGHFPGRPSKPTPKTLSDLRAFVADGDVEMGIGHDGDADRVVVVDADGNVVHEDTVVAILAEYYVRSSSVSDPVVVTTPNASGRIDERVEAAGGRVERVRLGALHEGIQRVESDDGAQDAESDDGDQDAESDDGDQDAESDGGDHDAESKGGNVVFAAEPWKHIHPAFGRWIDGVTSAALVSVLVAAAGGLSPLRSPVTERPYRKKSVSCPDESKEAAMVELADRLPERYPEAAVDTDYGIRLDFADGSWLLVRPSGTEPYVRLYAESEDIDSLVRDALEVVTSAIEAREG
jgi:phosphomannomutase